MNYTFPIIKMLASEAMAVEDNRIRQSREIENKIAELCERHNVEGVFTLTDTGVAPLVNELLAGVPRLAVEAGEGSKSVSGLEKVWHFLTEGGALRRSVLVNIGGGMVSDLGGFAAATFKRGIGCINVPTTLLAAVDASIGGKTGINFAGLKNEVGAFSLPWGVFPLTSVFDTLSEAEWLSGAGEAIKTGLLDSKELYDLATSKAFLIERDPLVVREVVERCATFKERVVEKDFREGGMRKILNLGHTAGHAIESWKMGQGNPMPHGIAVAHGLRFALELSAERTGFPTRILDDYNKVLELYFPPLEMTAEEWKEAAALVVHDKKNMQKGGEPAWILLKDIGEPSI